MQKLTRLGVVAAGCLLGVGCGSAMAADAAGGPLWSYLEPTVTTVASGLVGLAVTWAAARFHALTGITIARKYQDDLHRAADTGIHMALDKAGGLVAGAVTGQAKSAVVGEAMRWIATSVPTALDALGLTPDQLSDFVAAKLNAIVAAKPPRGVSPPAGA